MAASNRNRIPGPGRNWCSGMDEAAGEDEHEGQ